MKELELTPVDGRKSFYGKAHVIITDDGWTYLRSYDTIVAGVGPNGGIHRYFSAKTTTTSRHIKSFLTAFFSPSFSVKEFYELELHNLKHQELAEEL